MVHYLKNDPGPHQVPKFDAEDVTPFNVSASNYTHSTHQFNEEKNDLALGYTFVDVKDEENEGKSYKGEKFFFSSLLTLFYYSYC